MDEFDKINAFSQDLNHTQPHQNNTLHDFSDLQAPFSPITSEAPRAKVHINLATIIVFVAVVLGALLAVILLNPAPADREKIVLVDTNEPVKTIPAPNEQGGEFIPNQDKMVYERLRSDDLDTKVEKMFPDMEQPVQPVWQDAMAPDADFRPIDEVKGIDPLALSPEDIPDPRLRPVVVKHTDTVPPTKAESLPLAPAAEVKTHTFTWAVQLISSPDKAKAEKTWQTVSKKHPALFADVPHEIMTATLPQKGTYYRLRVGDFRTRAEAKQFCQKLKTKKIDCLPAKHEG